MFVALLGWIAVPLGLAGMAFAAKSRWGFALMTVSNLLWIVISLDVQCGCMMASSAIYSCLTLRNTFAFRAA